MLDFRYLRSVLWNFLINVSSNPCHERFYLHECYVMFCELFGEFLKCVRERGSG